MKHFRQVAQKLYLLQFQWQLRICEPLNTRHVSPVLILFGILDLEDFFIRHDLFPWQFLGALECTDILNGVRGQFGQKFW